MPILSMGGESNDPVEKAFLSHRNSTGYRRPTSRYSDGKRAKQALSTRLLVEHGEADVVAGAGRVRA
jgi:hypothetical protein